MSSVNRMSFRFNPASPGFSDRIYADYHYMREHTPVYRLGRTWVLTRYHDVTAAIRNKNFGNTGIPEQLHAEIQLRGLTLSPPLRDLLYGIVLFEEGDIHGVHRGALMKVFQGEHWNALSEKVASEAQTLVQQMSAQTLFDGIQELAASLWDRLFADWLNLSDELQLLIRQEKDAIRLLLDPSTMDIDGLHRLIAALENLDGGFMSLLQAHLTGHESLFFRALKQGYQGNEKLLCQRFSTDCITLLIGGSETSEALTGNLLFILAQNHDIQQQLRDSPSLIRNMIQEVMRYESPLQMVRRTVKVQSELHGRVLRPGDSLLLCLGAANRDEQVFAGADRFLPGRKNARQQIGFGAGAHQCIGQLLAQLQAERITLALLQEGKFQMEGEPCWSQKSIIVRALASLPLRLS